jgi:hypothetical protein
MSEEESSDIPQHLRDGLPSAEAYEQDARREYQIAETAWRLKIPRESLRNMTVRRYVSVLRDLEAAHERLEWPEAEEFVTPEGSPREDRERQVRVLYMAGEMLMKDGFANHRADISQLKHWFDGLAQRYGAEVEYDRVQPAPEPHRATGPLWTGRSADEPAPQVPWPTDVDESGQWWDRFDLPNERHDREHLGQLAHEARRQMLRPDAAGSDPIAHGLLARLVHGRRLVVGTTALAGLPEAPGLTPSAQERLTRIAPLNRLAVAVLEEEFHPGRLSPSVVTGELNEVGRAYGLKIRTA